MIVSEDSTSDQEDGSRSCIQLIIVRTPHQG
jgi:hypothetical protein